MRTTSRRITKKNKRNLISRNTLKSIINRPIFDPSAWTGGSSCDISDFPRWEQNNKEDWKINDRNDDPIETERKKYESNKSKYLNEFEGKYIALLNGVILDSDSNFSSLAERVYPIVGYKEVFITLVTSREKPHRISSKFK